MNRLFIAVTMLLCAFAAPGAPRLALHPFVKAELEKYPPLKHGGFRIVMSGGRPAAVIGVGRAKLTAGFYRAAAVAELDADAQIGRALNAVIAECETGKNTAGTTVPGGETQIAGDSSRRIALHLAARTPLVCSAGMWQHGAVLYCARVLWCGEAGNAFADFDGEWSRIPESLPHLGSGGTLTLRRCGTLHLVTAVRVSESLTPPRRAEFARIQAVKNLLTFVGGGKVELQLVRLTEVSSSQEGTSRRVRRRKQLKNAAAGSCRFLEPLAEWPLPGTGCRISLFAVPIRD